MLVRLTEAVEDTSSRNWTLKEVSINPRHVVAVRPDHSAKNALYENRMPEGLSRETEFTRVYLDTGGAGLSVLVIGSQDLVEEKLRNSRDLLKG